MKSRVMLCTTYGLALISAIIWLGFVKDGFGVATSEWHQHDRVSAILGLAFIPLAMGIASVALPLWLRRRGKNAPALYTAVTILLFFLPWVVFIGREITVGVVY